VVVKISVGGKAVSDMSERENKDVQKLEKLNSIQCGPRTLALYSDGVLSYYDESEHKGYCWTLPPSEPPVESLKLWFGLVNYALSGHHDACVAVQKCCQKHKLGLGGENIFELLVKEYDSLRTERAQAKADYAKMLEQWSDMAHTNEDLVVDKAKLESQLAAAREGLCKSCGTDSCKCYLYDKQSIPHRVTSCTGFQAREEKK
jgi:hypothetical protein